MTDLRLKSLKTHEIAREQNKREQRKFDLTTGGRYNEFKFKLDGISKEQKIIEKDLERIRAGVHRPPNTALADKSYLNPLSARNHKNRGDKHSPKRSPKPSRKSEKLEIDTDMLVEYLQKIKDVDVSGLNDLLKDINIKVPQPVNQKMASDPEMYQCSVPSTERSGSLIGKHQSLSSIEDVNSQSRGGSNVHVGDLIHKTTTFNQSHLKSQQTTVMEGISDKEQSKKSNETDKTRTVEQKKSKPEDINGQIHYEPFPFGNEHSMRMLNSDKQWEQARAARYVRTREPLERDRELSVKEIFDQTTREKI